MKANSSRPSWLSLFFVFVALFSLTGCQLLGNNQTQVNDTVVVSDTSVDFGKVAVGKKKSASNTLTNFKASSITIVSIAGLDTDFQLSGISLPLTLNSGQSAAFTVEFQPSKIGNLAKTVQFGDNSEYLVSMNVGGEGVDPGSLTLNPSAVNFGNVRIGTSQTTNVTLSNSGATDLTISQATLSGASFSMGNLTLPLTLAPGASTSLSVSFAPTGTGSFSGSVTFTSDAAAQSQAQAKKQQAKAQPAETTVLALNGNGVNPQGTLSANPTSIAFGNVQVGNTGTKSETLTNTGAGPVTISQANVTGAGYSITGLSLPATLNPNQSVTFTVRFAPANTGAVNGNLAIISDGTNSPLNIPLTGTGVAPGQLGANPTSLAFGNVVIGTNKTLSETLTNTGGSSLTISAATITGSGMSITGLTLPVTLNAGQSTTFSVRFSPAAAGAVNGNLTVTSNGSNPTLTIPVSGTGVTPGTLDPTPDSLAFGSVTVGSSASLTETLTNIGGANVTISQANVTGSGYSITGLTLPTTLTPNQSVSFTVKFTPAGAGNVNGNIAVISNGSNSPLNIPLTGDGLAPGSLTASPTSVSFGNVVIGNNKTIAVTVTNNGGVNVTISNAAVTGNAFSFTGPNLPLTLGAGQSTTFNTTFTPPSQGTKNGSLTITSDASNPTLTVPLQGVGVTPGTLTPNPASLTFGNVVIGSNKQLTETLTNTGGSSLTISAATITGTGMSISGLTLPVTLNANQSVSFTVQFAPPAGGAVSGNLTITSNGSNPTLTIPVSGTGVAPGGLSANPTTVAFGSVKIGTTSTLSETLTNTGGADVTISSATVTGSGFSISGLTLPVILTPSQTVTFSVKFTPTVAGAANGNIAIASDAPGSPLNIPLTGTGVPPGTLSANPTSLAFGSVVVGNNKSLTETLTNTGGSNLTISAASITGSGMSISGLTVPLTLTPNQSTTFSVRFAPTVAGAVSGNLTLSSDASNPTLTIPVSGTGVAPGTLTANPTTLAFGNVQVGNTGSLSETLTNTGGVNVIISQANVTGTGFSITGLTLPTTLTPNQSVTFTTRFAPTGTGASNGTLSIVSDASNSPLSIPMSGTGTAQGQLSVTPATLAFGDVSIGSSSPLTGSLTATGASVTVNSGASDSSEFVLSGITFPKTIAAGASTTYTVTFTPNAAGAASGTLTFVSNASNSPTTQGLTGNGVTPPPHSVDLNWNASGSSGVVGYNIYRRKQSGSYGSPINTNLNAGLTFTDNNVTAGQTYFYVVRAVDGNNVESTNSNEAQATIPTP